MTEGATPAPRFVNERDLLLEFVDEIGETGLFVDVGAHIGSFSEGFAKRGWQVIAVEPAPEIHAELVERMASYPQVKVVHAAANETGGADVEFFISSEHWGIHSLRPFHETHDKSVRVPSIRVRDLLAGEDWLGPLVLKTDTEGADLLVLRGVDWDAVRPRIVLCEFMDERTQPHFGYRYTDLIGFMEERGYRTYISEWASVTEPARHGAGGGPFTHLQVVRAPLGHQPSWGNLIFLLPEDLSVFDNVLHRYLVATRRYDDELIAAAAASVDRLSHLEQSVINRETTIEGLRSKIASLTEEADAERERHDSTVAKLVSSLEAMEARVAKLKRSVERRNRALRRRDRRFRLAVGFLLAVCVVLAVLAVTR